VTLGDGIRRDVATVSQAERDLLLDAFLKIDTQKAFPDGVSYWDKQEDIHKNAHFAGVDVHRGPAFIPWHRVIVNRLEALLREVHPEISLHYWDWTTDPRVGSGGRVPLMTNAFIPMQTMETTPPTKVIYGVNELDLDLAGKTVRGIWKALEQVLNIPRDAAVSVNGSRVEDDYVLRPGDEIEFQKQAGVKGLSA
jgi:hypothetical protein